MSTSIYTHKTGTADEIRLQLLNDIHNGGSQAFILKNLRSSDDVLDVGCGQGQMTLWLAQQTTGHVLSIDSSEEQIAIAKNRVRAAGVKNVDFKVMSAFDIASLNQQFDLIYGRFLLVHVQNPIHVIKAASACLKPGGRLLWEEATVSASFCEPKNAAFDQWISLWKALRESKNTELDAGLRLPQWFRESGLHQVKAQIFQPILNTPREKEMIWRNVAGTKHEAVDIGFATADEVDTLIQNLKQLTEEDHLIGFVRNSQTSGTQAISI